MMNYCFWCLSGQTGGQEKARGKTVSKGSTADGWAVTEDVLQLFIVCTSVSGDSWWRIAACARGLANRWGSMAGPEVEDLQ